MVDTIEVTRDQRPMDHNPVDTSVALPKHVQEAARAAEALHGRLYPAEAEPEPAPDKTQAAQAEPEPAQQHPAQGDQQVQPQITATVNQNTDPFVEAATPSELKDSVWAQRYNSMRGRWEAQSREIGQLQQLVNDLGQELRATQQAIAAPQAQAQTPRDHEKLITDKDRETFGDDLIDVARKAAREAIAPDLDALRNENANLNKRVTTTAQGELRASLAAAVPNWININRDARFHGWLRLRNPYTGQVRGELLNAAYRAANAPQVIATFKDFLSEVRATGGEVPGQRQEQQQAPAGQQAPHEPAIQLDTLAAPGRARPAGGDSQVPADKPIYSRAQISNFYRDVRRNAYAGREADKNRIEADIIAAQSEGRVRG
jgi:hypothetical protein